jgi:hypothetical protein
LIPGWRRIKDRVMMRNLPDSVIPPLSVVKLIAATADEPAWIGCEGRTFRIGYYRKSDGLDCVWLVDDRGNYGETVDQKMIRTHFEVLEKSQEADFYGVNRPEIGPCED